MASRHDAGARRRQAVSAASLGRPDDGVGADGYPARGNRPMNSALNSASESDRSPAIAPVPQSPTERLEASRARLRRALEGGREPAPKRAASSAPGTAGAGMHSFIDRTMSRLQGLWSRHPLRPAAHVFNQTAMPLMEARLKPWAETHPMRIVGIAIGTGALLGWLRPWRWLSRAGAASLLLSVLLPRRLIFRELMNSSLVQRLVDRQLHADGAVRDGHGVDDDMRFEPPAVNGSYASAPGGPSHVASAGDAVRPH